MAGWEASPRWAERSVTPLAERCEMSPKTEPRLTPQQRLSRGLSYSAIGPAEITRGVIGLGAHSARTGAANLRQRYGDGQLAQQLSDAPETVAKELAAAQEVVAGLPQALQAARRPKRRRRRWVIATSAAVIVGGGVVAFSVIRRSARPQEPSPLPPSVEVPPKP